MQKVDSKTKTKILEYLRNLPAKECEELLNYIFVLQDPYTGENVDLKMHKAILYKIQRRLDKQIVDLCGLQSIQAVRQYLDRAFLKIYFYLQRENISL